MMCSTCMPTLISTRARSRRQSARTESFLFQGLQVQTLKPGRAQYGTNHWHQITERLTLFAMSETSSRKSVFRVLGIDPAAAGPTGYGVVESDGRRCRTLHYGALKVAEKLRKE